jgi:hypothetical protein
MLRDFFGFLVAVALALAGLFVFWLVTDTHEVDRAIIAWKTSVLEAP